MSRDDIRKLLGGYATDTLSEEERRTLFEAALGTSWQTAARKITGGGVTLAVGSQGVK